MIKVKISGLKVADYLSPTDGWNYDALDSLAKELCDRYREAEAERTVELFENYIERIEDDTADTSLRETIFGISEGGGSP